MRAYSMEWEMDILISKEDARKLKESPLVGTIKRNEMHADEPYDRIPLVIQRGKTSKENECVDLQTTPDNAFWKEATAYRLIVSDFAYSQIEELGGTGERLYGNPACKISIKISDFG